MGLFDAPKSGNEAAGQALGSAAGAATGLPLGGTIGSFLGGKIGSIFGGGGQKRETLGVQLMADTSGKLSVGKTATKGSSLSNARAFGDEIAYRLNTIGQALGVQFKNIGGISTNIGSKDTGSWFGSKNKVSSSAGDVDAITLAILKQDRYYTGTNTEALTLLKNSAASRRTLSDVVSDIDAYLSKNTNATENAPSDTQQAQSTASSTAYIKSQEQDDVYGRVTSAASSNTAIYLIAAAVLVIMLRKG